MAGTRFGCRPLVAMRKRVSGRLLATALSWASATNRDWTPTPGPAATVELREAAGTRVQAAQGNETGYAALTGIFCSAFLAASVFGNTTLSTPFLNVASTLPASTPSGIRKLRSKEPKRRSDKW